MNQQKSLAEQFAENRKWIEIQCRKLGLEETPKTAEDGTKQDRLGTNRVFVPKQRPQQRS